MRTIETDVCVVGAGLLGLAHAHEARRRGLSVVLLERDARAVGSSLRDSGHLFFSALPAGAALAAADLARERWLELTERAGLVASRGGTLIVARHLDELAVMEAAAADPARGAKIRGPKKIAKLAALPIDGVVGAFHAKQDVGIDPRAAPAGLARLLLQDASAHIEWRTPVQAIEPGVVHAGGLRVRADAIVVCPGSDHRMLAPELWPRERELTLCEAQMLRVTSPGGRRYRQTLSTGLSLLDFPAFCTLEGIDALRDRLELQSPELIERGASLVIAQHRSGDLTVGSTATYTDVPTPFSRDRLDDLLLAQAGLLLGAVPVVRQRWRSTNSTVRGSPDDFLTTKPMPGVRMVLATGNTAAALCHVHAGSVLDELLAGPPDTDMYITVRDMRQAPKGGGGIRDHARAFGTRPQPEA